MTLAASILAKATVTMTLALAAARLAPRSRASVRHVLLAAAFAMLLTLPIASVFAPPLRIPLPIAPPVAFVPTIDDAAATLGTAEPSRSVGAPVARAAQGRAPASLFPALSIVWTAGVFLFLLRFAVGLRQMRSLRRSASRWPRGQSIAHALAVDDGVRCRVDVLLHPTIPGPMTCGAVHPAIILPADAPSWTDADLHRAIAHEVEHVRRGDWLTQSLARAIAGCYWFHPLVWLAWRQFTLEAERACDDAVLRRAEPDAYADQLVMLAKRMLDRRRPLVAMAGRSDLALRVRALLDGRQRRGPAGAAWIATAAAAAIVLVASMSALQIVTASPRAGSPAPTFEVASVKVCKQEPNTNGQRRPEWRMPSPGRISVECIPLQRIIYFAYAGIGNMDNPLVNDSAGNPDHVRGGPGWIRTEKFTIEARAEGAADRTVMMGPMLRALLEDRFQLKTHRESEEAPMYALTVAKGGLKIKPIGDGGCTAFEATQDLSREEVMALNNGPTPICGNFTAVGDGANRTWILGGDTMEKFANQTLSSVLDRFVTDKTGVSGLFNIHLTFGIDESIRTGVFGGAGVNPPPADIERGPSIFTALEEQLGLKLERTKGPREFLVIDRVQRPGPD